MAGTDRATYLQGLLTNDIPALTPGTGCYSAWLTPQGRMLTDMHVLESGDMILLDVPAETAEATLERLEQFIFTEDVRSASLAGSLTRRLAPRAEGAGRPRACVLSESDAALRTRRRGRDYQHAQLEFRGQPVSVARIDQLGVPGSASIVEPSREAASRRRAD